MAKLPDMGKMIGPLPLGAWLAVIGGGLGVAYYTRSQGGDEPVTDPDLMPEDVGGVPGVGVGGSGQWVNVDPPSNNGTRPKPSTNEEWAQRAIEHLIASGYPAMNADAAVRKYITAAQLGVSEKALIGIAIGAIGPLPVALPPAPDTPTPNPPTPKPAPKGKYIIHRVRKGDTLWRIGNLYGVNPWVLFYENDKLGKRPDGSAGWVTNPNSLKEGWTIVVSNPKKLLG